MSCDIIQIIEGVKGDTGPQGIQGEKGDLGTQDIIYLSFSIVDGQVSLNVPAVPLGILLVIDGAVQEKDTAYTYNALNGNITLVTPLTGNEEVYVIYGALVSNTSNMDNKPSGVIPFATVSQMVLDNTLESGDKVQTYFYNADVLCEWQIVAAGTGAGDMSDATLNLTGSALQAKLVINETMTPLHFGAYESATTDNTTAVQYAFDNCENVIINNFYGVTSVTAKNYITCTSSGGFKALGTSNSRVLTINSKLVGDIIVDGNQKDVNCVFFPAGLGYQQTYSTIKYSGVTVTATSGNTNTGVTMFGDNVTGGAVYGSDMVNAGSSNDSFPQGFVTGLGRYHIESHDIKDSVSGFTTTGGNVFLGSNRCTNMEDNGCYLLGGDVVIGINSYEGAEEATQINAVQSAVIDSIVARGRCLGAFNYQNCGFVSIGSITGVASVAYNDSTLPSNIPTSIFYARSGNVTSGEIRIGQVRGYFMEGVLTNAGSLNKLTIGDTDATLCYAPSQSPLNKWVVNPTSANCWDFRGCQQVSRQDIKINIKNFESTAWPTGIISVNHPTFSKYSHIDNEVFNLLENDDTIAGSQIEYRGGRPQENLIYTNVHWSINAGSINMREAQEAGWQMNAVRSVPTDGYWYAGTVLSDRSGTNTQFVCTVTGDPATWTTK
tara:strand:- start:8556 stop:10541 length:1986 start_codon:yes stop_codon:yes gene_type:complete